ncbi:MAG: ubiquinol-cytochrome c reductase cytochrome b subunit [Sporichthyaceae bacterium]|nr:ubiquinol-cytochrome c reductase cytochrome b subunit [Sporichthyaceae bacterium]
MSTVEKVAGGVGNYLDERVGLAGASKKLIRKVFPEHWSFLLGEIALWSFVVLLLTGTWLTFFFKPSMVEVVYNGSYQPLQGQHMSEAYASTLDISFDIRGGMIMRQIHHWAALIFVAAICIHLLRIFFTGAFRKPRELNWIIGNILLTLALLEGFAGYSLPDDLLSGTGLRIAEGVLLSIPLVGTYASFFLFGGEFPGNDLIPRLFTIHILLIPALMVALITVHLLLVFMQKHTQWSGPGKTEKSVVGYPFLPIYMAKTGGFFFIVFGVCALLGGLAQINPIWLYGPYHPAQVSAGSQPDWYIGFLEGALRAMPNWEINALGHTLSLNVLIPALIVPGIFFTVLAIYPFIEQWITGDKREHHLLQRPRNVPTRTAFGVAGITFFGILWLNGGNDLIAERFRLSFNTITWFTRIFIFVGPVLAYWITKRICLGLQRRDRDKVLHGRETGIIRRLPTGEFIEVHEPIPVEDRYVLTAHEVAKPHELGPDVDENGIPNPNGRKEKVRAVLSRWYFGDRVDKPTSEEYQAITSGHDHH